MRSLNKQIVDIIQAHRKAFLWQGVVMILLGVAAAAAPVFATLTAEVLFGWLMLLGGTIRLVGMLSTRKTPGAWWQVVIALVLLAFGVFLIVQPLAGVITLTQLFLVYLIAHGIASFFTSLQLKPFARSWSGLLLSGIVDGLLVVVIIAGWPDTSHWILGLLLGCNLFFFGLALLFVALDGGNT